jgi:hypothetical protein
LEDASTIMEGLQQLPSAQLIETVEWNLMNRPASVLGLHEQGDIAGCGVTPLTGFHVSKEHVLCEVLRQIGPDAVDIDASHIDDPSSSDGLPCRRDPTLCDKPIDQNVEMGIARLLELKHRNEGNAAAALSFQRGSKFVPTVANVRG